MAARGGRDARRAGRDAPQRRDRARQLQQRRHHEQPHVGAGAVKEPIDVEPAVYDASSKVFGDKVYSQLLKSGSELEGGLAGSGAMAGSDPAGVQWAASYDEAACGVHAVLIDLETACLKIAVMLQQ